MATMMWPSCDEPCEDVLLKSRVMYGYEFQHIFFRQCGAWFLCKKHLQIHINSLEFTIQRCLLFQCNWVHNWTF